MAWDSWIGGWVSSSVVWVSFSVAGFHFWWYGFQGSMDGFHFWWCGWLGFIIPWFGGCGFCGLVAVEVDQRLAWVLTVRMGMAVAFFFFPSSG